MLICQQGFPARIKTSKNRGNDFLIFKLRILLLFMMIFYLLNHFSLKHNLRTKFFCLSLAVIFCSLFTGQTNAQDLIVSQDMPSEIGTFPGAQLDRVINFPKSNLAVYYVTSSPKSIADHYKRQLGGKGWKISTEDVRDGSIYLVMVKAKRQVIINIGLESSGQTKFTLNVSN